LLRATPGSSAAPWHATAATILTRYPCLVVVTVAAIVMYPATWSLTEHDEWGAWLPWMTIVDVTVSPPAGAAIALLDGLLSGQLWRLVTPSLLHFSLPHLGFNLAVVLGFGMRIERAAGTATLAAVIVAIAVASNLVQYAISANGLFGGLSGVAYGLFAYVVVRGMREPHVRVWRTQKALIVSLLTFLVLMTTGVAEVFGVYIANAAHWTGLVIGGVLGYAATRRGAW
jgi:GlpG protein